MTSREDNVLAARNPALTDENEWEEFSLSEVRVLVPGKSRYANLLSASPDYPVQVTGCLDEVEEEQESLVLDPEYLTKRIVLDNVTHYAYGQHNDGEVGFWVAGRAGWFSISPAKGYKPMFNEVVEAIDLLYFLADRHKRKRGRRRFGGPSLEYLCEEYVSHTHGICEDADDSAEVFYKHHSFLLSRMLKGEEDVQWTTTSIFIHLSEKFPVDYEQIKAQIEGVDEVNSDEEEETTPDNTDDEASRAADSSGSTKADANAIYQVILDLKEEGYLAKRQLNLELVASTLVSRFEIEDDEYARSRIASSAEVILELMDEAKTSSFDWSRKVIYRELKAASKQHDGASQEAFTPLRPRLLEDEASSPEDSDQEDLSRKRKRRVLKSVLRPKSTVATKRTGKRTRNAATDTDEESTTNADAMDEFETPSKVRGHDLVRDPLSTRAKRTTRSILSDSESAVPTMQKTSRQDVLQSRNTSVSAADIDSLSHEEPEVDGANGEDVQSDTWTCQVRGCGKIVYKCSTKRGRQLIQDHSLAHADDTKARLDLVFAEQRLNIGLPVDNLLSRIREMAGGDEAGLTSMEGALNGASDAMGT
ncbi:uncharacterized protein BP01DRAFT_357567 [Aspergillus saccharolyticus JOP 1030-1]|uniref:DNA (cytosine-5)-methyltransferase 1 replication foci domain-containing protein n=1 Tax=Aspergillus saccharolyticus JOP 1030-1 TaxID=1450539 RepID=A0A318ZLA9_9EURO|nr:hypothetical protein BP01DRAFT_357567 [Aspergillus saccharolyticus JOP 1030-1]PYH44580.1 hypothetical protein BP01DRAFT_357567 [Aspergillus saccharolyticus JOP 1030-1]